MLVLNLASEKWLLKAAFLLMLVFPAFSFARGIRPPSVDQQTRLDFIMPQVVVAGPTERDDERSRPDRFAKGVFDEKKIQEVWNIQFRNPDPRQTEGISSRDRLILRVLSFSQDFWLDFAGHRICGPGFGRSHVSCEDWARHVFVGRIPMDFGFQKMQEKLRQTFDVVWTVRAALYTPFFAHRRAEFSGFGETRPKDQVGVHLMWLKDETRVLQNEKTHGHRLFMDVLQLDNGKMELLWQEQSGPLNESVFLQIEKGMPQNLVRCYGENRCVILNSRICEKIWTSLRDGDFAKLPLAERFQGFYEANLGEKPYEIKQRSDLLFSMSRQGRPLLFEMQTLHNTRGWSPIDLYSHSRQLEVIQFCDGFIER